MSRRLKRLIPSPAMIVALVALFVALGGVSYGVAVGFVDSRDIKNNTVRSKDVRNGTLTGSDIKHDGIGSGAIAEGTLSTVPARWSRAARTSPSSTAAARSSADAASPRPLGPRTAATRSSSTATCAAAPTSPRSATRAPPARRRTARSASARSPSNVNGVAIRTENGAGVEQNRPFHLIVMC